MNKDDLLDCTLCPRECHVNRTDGKMGYCKEGMKLVVARAALHMWEEPCISGDTGSGAIFFSGCSVGCVFCQNAAIASGKVGKEISNERMVEIFFELQEKGAKNINLVTPTHFVPQIIACVRKAKEQGLKLPIVYNTSGYEKRETIEKLRGIIDIYLTDLKYVNQELSSRYSNAKDYFQFAKESLEEMVEQVPVPMFDQKGIMTKGVIVRHLVLPGQKEDSKRVVKYLYETYGDQIYISIMNQFTPRKEDTQFKELQRCVTSYEYHHVVDYAVGIGVKNGFIQKGKTALESFIPSFDLEGV